MHAEPARVTLLDALVFVDELVLLVVVAVSGASIDGPLAVRIVAAVGGVAVFGAVWGRWLAPKAAHPLPYPARLGVKLVVFLVAAAAFAATGHAVGAAVFLVVSAALVIASERERHTRSP
jgi:hypothetical protein